MMGKTFVRKWPTGGPDGKGITMLITLVSGDLALLEDENVYAIGLTPVEGISPGNIVMSLYGNRPAPEMRGMGAEGIVRML